MPLDVAKRLAVSKDKPDRVQALQLLKAHAKPGTAPGDEALARYGDLCLRFLAEGEKSGLEEARRAFTELKDKSHSRWGLKSKVGLARVAAAEGRREEAVKTLDWFLSNQGTDDAFIEAAYYLGCIQAEAKDDVAQLQLARRSLEYALKLWKAQESYYAGDLTEAEISGKLGWVNGRIRDLKEGPLKVAFEKAERLRQAKKFEEATPAYEAVIKEDPEHIFSECSRLRIGQCLEGLKKFAEARRHYEEFIKANPTGPYRGHAHLQLGDIWLEQEFRAACAEVEYSAILHPEKYAVPDPGRLPDFWRSAIDPKVFQLRPDTTVPTEDPLAAEALQATDVSRRKALVMGELPRAAHETWAEVTPDAHIRLGIVTYMRADIRAADQNFSVSYQMRPDESRGRGVPSGVLLLAEKCRKREMPLPWQLLTVGGDQPRVCLFLAGIYLEGDQADRAMKLYSRVADGEFKDAHPEQVAYALCQKGEAFWRRGQGDEARAVWRKFQSKPLDATSAAPSALLRLGCTSYTKTQDVKYLTLLEEVYTRHPGSDAAPTALFQHASAVYQRDPQLAMKLLQTLQNSYPGSAYKTQISGFMDDCRKREETIKKWREEEARKKTN